MTCKNTECLLFVDCQAHPDLTEEEDYPSTPQSVLDDEYPKH